MGEDFGATLELLRARARLSRQGLAKRIGYTYQYVWQIETGRRPPTEQFAHACDQALGGSGQLLAFARKDDVKRRTMLGVGAMATLETIRHALTRTVAGVDADRVDLDEWEAIAWEYGHTYLVTPASDLIDQLSADFLTVESLIAASGSDTRAGYCRVASRLAVVTARTWSSLGGYRQAWRWWRTARLTADASGDLDTRVMCRGEEVVMGLYERRPISVLLTVAEEAAAIGGARPSRGAVGLWAGIAQANATIGRAAVAVAALRRLEELTERLPIDTVAAGSSLYGWPEYRVRHTESFVQSLLGDTRAAYSAQERALALYPDSVPVPRAQVQIHGARCMVLDGDIRGGLARARLALAEVPADRVTDKLITSVGRKVIDAVPAVERGRDDVRDLMEAIEC